MRISNTDFTGFTFDGIHSSELNIYRVSDGDRYDETLHPDVNDRTTEIPGNDGEYFFGSNYGQRTFTINIAYDSVTETQFRKIRRLFSTKKICPIIFDERPYKVYYVKISEPVELNYICFDEPYYDWVNHQSFEPYTEGEEDGYLVYWTDSAHSELTFDQTNYPFLDDQGNQYKAATREFGSGGWVEGSINHKVYQERVRRIYKGEGTIELVAYHPYAHQLFKVLDYYEEPVEYANAVTSWANVGEWAHSSGILDLATYSAKHLDEPEEVTSPEAQTSSNYNVKIPVYNPGDVNTGMYLYIPYYKEDTQMTKIKYYGSKNLQSEVVLTMGSQSSLDSFTVVAEYVKTTIEEGEEQTTTINGTFNFTKGEAHTEPFEDIAVIKYDGDSTVTAVTPETVGAETEVLISVIKSVNITYTATGSGINPNSGDYIIINGDTGTLYLEPFTAPTDDNNFETGILINSNNRLIEGVHFDVITDAANRRSLSWKTTGRIYNDHIKKGEFPKILKSDWLSLDRDENTEEWDLKQAIWINCAQGEQAIIHYDYLYF